MKASELKKGMAVEYDGELNIVSEVTHITPGNKRAIYQVKLKSMRSGRVVTRRFSPSNEVTGVTLEPREMEYLYADGSSHVFMDTGNFEQTYLSGDLVGDALPYIRLNSTVRVLHVDGKPISVELPASVVLEITAADPGVRGDTVTNVKKSARLETGLEIKVPSHINQGDKVKVDTRSGEFIERVNE